MARYFALLHGKNSTPDNPSGIFREVDGRFEYMDKNGSWKQKFDLAKYVYEGEEGAELIPASKVDGVIKSFKAKLKV